MASTNIPSAEWAELELSVAEVLIEQAKALREERDLFDLLSEAVGAFVASSAREVDRKIMGEE